MSLSSQQASLIHPLLISEFTSTQSQHTLTSKFMSWIDSEVSTHSERTIYEHELSWLKCYTDDAVVDRLWLQYIDKSRNRNACAELLNKIIDIINGNPVLDLVPRSVEGSLQNTLTRYR